MDWKARYKNKPVLMALISSIVALVYQILSFFGVVTPISQSDLINTISILLNVLVTIGVITDPNTAGITDKDKNGNEN